MPQPPPGERQLVDNFRGGSRRAYDVIYRTYRGRVERTCRRYLFDDRDVEEAVQDTFTRAYLALDRFNGQFRLGAWLAQIAANVSLDVLRRNRRHVEVTSLDRASQHPDSAPTPETVAIEAVLPTDVLDAMKTTHVRALLLRGEGYSHAEIGDELGASPAQVKAMLHRARESFKRAWRAAGAAVIVVAFTIGGAALPRLVRLATGTASAAARVQTAAAGTADAVAAPLASLTAEAERLL